MIFLGACRFSLACELKMTDEYIESTCGLTNGVRFEELNVDTFYTDGKPKIYKVVCSYTANPYANGPADKVRDRIYFYGNKGDCYWSKDTATNGVYKNFGISREMLGDINDLLNDSAVEIRTYITEDSMVVKGGKPPRNVELYSTRVTIKCPLKFKPNTWYYVNFYDQRYEAYLYVDNSMAYNLFKQSLPTNF
ncbi:hypothetical protein [Ferruginibacter sp.]